ncbi:MULTISPECIES: carbonic anhydrase family protein [unclassified Undibacterium]|uniref:carbonic anhydrase n=1 Tax=unclassified Undibacterium TaxID=2630295 RepID=UPI002AC9DDF0|nr:MULTISPECIES: carbonic anhydrase family protein [unclassified Undibacterium]MEB0139532.1 carbonic anhydrase family protein [Undibacterium sp. CCC2.1]MEB0172359.1 carbonic anhydrase family protein [Undibacterium sp. CCC1.1]MEB0175686.1 carbonic anhydrase family protein [Undibacterium sp. CCC3.4]MEB0214474.1 carbonic anhydrase family protein [Undibacterium sp. 5I2]WPX42871.1 carbonic anhydrase family protein [Undibacterium sp. CCC3.4]
MKKMWMLLTLSLMSTLALAQHGGWSYEGETGPEHWAKLSPESADCGGKNQSPVDLHGFVKAQLVPIAFNYHAGANEMINNGHTIQVNYLEGSQIKIDDMKFALKQFHFHAPAENLIMGKSYPLEAHFVHAADDGELVVIALMFKVGAENAALNKLWPSMPAEKGQKNTLPALFAAADLMPKQKDYYRFEGSLTTPPCTEGVRWLVLKHPVEASAKQIENFSRHLEHANNRPVQPTNARVILN